MVIVLFSFLVAFALYLLKRLHDVNAENAGLRNQITSLKRQNLKRR